MFRALFLFLSLAAAAAAQPRTETPPPRVGVTITQRHLSLQEAIEMALKSNLEIEIEKTNRDTAEEAVQAARGFFDPTFRWVPLLETRNTPTASVLQSATGKLTDRFLAQNFYLRHRLRGGGTQLSLDFENMRQATNNPFTSFTPFLTSRLAVGFTQPLARGRSNDRERAEFRIRRTHVDSSRVDYELRVIDVVTRVQQAYWDVVAARQDVIVKADGVGWAREQLALNQRMVNAGTLAPVELAAAEAELQRRLDNWYASVGVVTETENALKTLLVADRSDSLWQDEIVPSDEQMLESAPENEYQPAVSQALRKRPELRSVDLRRQTNDVEKALAADLRKPQFNLIGQYSLNGLAGTLRPGSNPFSESNAALVQRVNDLSVLYGLQPLTPISFGAAPGFLVGNYGTAIENLFGGRYQSFQVGLALDLTLRNRTAEANYAQSVIAEKRLKLERARLEQLIEAQVRNALQAIETARQRILAAEAGARAASEKLESETRLYQNGESTNFLVLTRQNEYTDSRRRVLVARLDFNKSVARLEQALGSTLEQHKIVLK
ncbi:MAG: TolC family protein [Acidobacteria bacterium]|nr:TolC family protein [Acidobacteriota bacterium]